jgi:GDPmannose 4,6-dehydratase
VTRKSAEVAVRIVAGLQGHVYLGDLDAVRDRGQAEECAEECIEAMWLMLQHPGPTGSVVATGTAGTVREFADHCFSAVGCTGPTTSAPVRAPADPAAVVHSR